MAALPSVGTTDTAAPATTNADLRDTLRPVVQRLASHQVQLCWLHPSLPLPTQSTVGSLRTLGALVVPLAQLAFLPSLLPLSTLMHGAPSFLPPSLGLGLASRVEGPGSYTHHLRVGGGDSMAQLY